ncbi:MAG: hypothetical protein QOE34_1138 [Verrucomicrobiota bacterium]
MNDDFQILFELLESQEVSGRSAATVSSDLREKIAKFAAGTCNEEEREQMKKMLREQPDLIPALVTEIRALRPSET